MKRDRFDEAASRLVMASPSGRRLLPAERKILEEGWVRHLILFRRSLRLRGEAEKLISLASSAVHGPALFAVDQEGGIVSALSELAGTPPSPMQIAAAGDPLLAEEWARTEAERLRRIGINMNIAPVLDLHSDRGSGVIGTRSFGSGPRLVSRMGAAALRGTRLGGAIAVGKHFPGHGGVRGDSHTALPVDRRPLAEIRRRDLLPFRAAVRERLPVVMIAHVAFPALGTGRLPATLSEEIIGGLLRRDMGFRGLVISDALEMTGFPGEKYLPVAFRAGIELFCAGHSLAQGKRVARLLAAAMRSGAIDIERALGAADKIEKLIGALPSPQRAVPSPVCEDWKFIAKRGKGAFRPLPPEGWRLLLPSGLKGRLSIPLDLSLLRERQGREPVGGKVSLYPFDPSPDRCERLVRSTGSDSTLILGLLGRGELPNGQKRLYRALRRNARRLVTVALLDPEPVCRLEPRECLFTFGFRPETMEALLQVLLGEKRPEGKLP